MKMCSVSLLFLVIFTGLAGFFLPVTNSQGDCGLRPSVVENRIVGGNEASEGSWPWQVLYQLTSTSSGNQRAICGGTLINKKWIVTAAHCTEGSLPYLIHMGLGVHNYLEEEPHAKRYAVSRIFDHPGYNSDTLENDISLIQLAGGVEFNDYISPACLPGQGEDIAVGTECWITGWGETERFDEPKHILREAAVRIVSSSQCQSWLSLYANISVFEEVQFCAGYEVGGIDTCQGDSGGPVVCENPEGAFVLHGVTSFGSGCAEFRRPGVYTRVSAYADWITKTVRDNSDVDPFFTIPSKACGSMLLHNETVRLPVNEDNQLYPSNTTCSWNIRNNVKGTWTIISFVGRFVVDNRGSGCADFVRISTSRGVQIGNDLCGHSLPSAVLIEQEDGVDVQMTFQSDSSLEFEGFAINVQFGDLPSDICVEHFVLRLQGNESRILTSPGYPDRNYENNLNCYYEVRAEAGFIITATFDLITESCCDYVEIYDGDLSLGRLKGVKESSTWESSGESLSFRFVTDFSNTNRGFRVTFRQYPNPFFAIPIKPCGSTILHDEAARLPVDEDNQLYFPDMTCLWTIQNELARTRTIISFVGRFRVENNGTRCVDFVRISTSKGVQIGQDLCGHLLPSDVVIQQEDGVDVHVTFQSDSSKQFEGFAINVQFNHLPNDVCTDNFVLYLSGYETQFVTSPGYPDRYYENHLNCNYEIRAEDRFRIRANFEVDTESCCDYIEIFHENGSSSRLKGKVSSSWESSNRRLSFRFVTDRSVTRKGFRASFQQFAEISSTSASSMSPSQPTSFGSSTSTTSQPTSTTSKPTTTTSKPTTTTSKPTTTTSKPTTTTSKPTTTTSKPTTTTSKPTTTTSKPTTTTSKPTSITSSTSTVPVIASVSVPEGLICSACSANASCSETAETNPCRCKSGFTGDGIECSDIDECMIFVSPCQTNFICFNLLGSYECRHNSGSQGLRTLSFIAVLFPPMLAFLLLSEIMW